MEEIVGIILCNWTGLKMSIEHGMGGKSQTVAEKISSMINAVMENLINAKVSWEEISDCLEEIMDVEFNTILEDDSTDEVAKVITDLFYLWKNGDQDGLNLKINQMNVKIPIQTKYQLQPYPEHKVVCEADTAGNSYIVEELSDNEWTEVKFRR